MSQTSSKTIAKNTAFLYARMILVMLVTLYTSRVILSTLGEVDYGIYNVVGGIVTIMTFLNGALGASTSRFLTFHLGKGDLIGLKNTFAATLNLHLAVAFLVILLGETIGLWFFYTQLNIPVDRVSAAFWVYQFSIITTCINFTQVPFNATLIAHENMSIYAYVGLYEAFAKLIIAYLISVSPIDNLVFYAGLLMLNTCLVQLFYRFYTRTHYEECHFRFFWDSKLYRQLMSYSGWDMFGGIATVCQGQGVNILLNIFFGPAVNAARAIAIQIQSAVTMFVNNFMVAARPQVIKSCASGDYERMYSLTFYSCKFAYLLMYAMVLPLCFEMDFILRVWLGEYPDNTKVFAIIILITALVNTWHSGFLMAYHAIGKIKTGNMINGTFMILTLPASWLLLKFFELDAYWVFIVILVTNFITHIISWIIVHSYIPFSYRKLLKSVYVPTFLISIVGLLVPFLICRNFTEGWTRLFINTLFSICNICTLSWWVAFSEQERKSIIAGIKKVLKIKNNA